ncbi:MAG: hypothetical protein QM736_20720 [Vicinamibacterales bacterium]
MSTEALRQVATAHMQRGRDLVATGERDALRRAVTLFDRAISIRRGTAAAAPAGRYDSAGAWLNRAEALLALGDPGSLDAALQALDEAVPLLETLPLDADPRYRRRLVVALQNRAIVRRRIGHDTWKALPDLFKALDVIETDAGLGVDDGRVARAAVWVNVADAQRAEPDPEAWRRAVVSAQRAVTILDGIEEHDVRAAGIGVMARHVCCEAAALWLARMSSETAASGFGSCADIVHAASDAVDEALGLIGRWERRGVDTFRATGDDLFEFGRRWYGCYQPQFLAEFEAEHSRGENAASHRRESSLA